MKQYLDLLSDVLHNGSYRSDRTGTGVSSTFGQSMRFDLSKGFPLLTTKKLHWPSIAHELLWFLSGSTNINYLKHHNVKIWDGWATPSGEIGPMYGKQWTAWETPSGRTINQIQQAIDTIKENPTSRRILVSAWNPSDLPDESIPPQQNVEEGRMALAACHAFFQFYVSNGALSCQVFQRSVDIFLGMPFNIASYALLTHLVAHQCDLQVGQLIWIGGDSHIYSNHFSQAELQLTREPKQLPQLHIKNKPNSIFEYSFDDLEITNYNPDPHIKGSVAI